MRRRRLGRTGLDISEIGFGAWGIGGLTAGTTSYGRTDDDISRAAIRRALERGINFFDTANVYGDGHSESLLGEMARSAKDVAISTKAGLRRFDLPPEFSAASVRQSIADSLKRLQRDSVEGLMLHNPAPAEIIARTDTRAMLDGLVRDGTLRFWGISMKAPAEGLELMKAFDVAVLQCNLNMLDVRAVTSGLLDLARQRETAVIARTPLCFGFLSGAIDENTVFPPGDHRAAWSKAQRALWTNGARDVVAAAEPPAGEPMSQTALRFCLSFPAVASVIPGCLTPAEVDANAAASAHGGLSARSVERVLELNQQMSFLAR